MLRRISLFLACALPGLVAPGPVGAQASAKYVVIHGVPVECSAAVAFRDGDLLQQYLAIESRWKDGTVDRYDDLLAQYKDRHARVAAKWAQAGAEARKQFVKELVMLGVSLGGERLGKAAEGQAAALGAGAAEQAALKEATEVLASHASLVAESALGTGPDMQDYFADLPAASRVLIATVSPPIAATISASKKVLDVADVIFAAWDWWLTEKLASQNLSLLEQAMTELIVKSPRSRLRELDEVKDTIDKTCG